MSGTAALRARLMILCVSCWPSGATARDADLSQARRAVENQTLRWQTPKLAEFWGWNRLGVIDARGPRRAQTLFALYNEGERPKDPVVCMRLDDGAPVAALKELPAAFGRLDSEDFLRRVATTADGLVALPSPDQPGVIAYEPCTMRQRWTFPLHPDDWVHALASAGDTLVVSVGPRTAIGAAERWRLMFVDGASGRLLRASLVFEGRPPDRLLCDGDRVVASRDPWLAAAWPRRFRDMQLAVFSVTTGQRLWHREDPAGEITVGGGHLVLINRSAEEIGVFDVATGVTEARIPVPAVARHDDFAVAADRGRLYYAFASRNDEELDTVVALDLPGGKVRWHRKVPLAPEPDLMIERDVVYVGTAGYFVTALDIDSGRSRWRWGIGRAFKIVRMPPTATDAPVPPLVVADGAGSLWRFARASQAVPVEEVVISGRVRSDGSMNENQSYGLTVGPRRVTTDRHGRFRVVLREPGAIRLAVDDEAYAGLYWRRDGGGEADSGAVIVRPGGPAGPRRWLDLRTTLYEDSCH